MAVYTKEYESQPEAILTNVIICPAVDLSANVAVPVHCQVENVLWDTGYSSGVYHSQASVNVPHCKPTPLAAEHLSHIVGNICIAPIGRL